jgi:TonB family protein
MKTLITVCLASMVLVASSHTEENSATKDSPPRLLKQVDPQYPPEALADGKEGTVQLEFVIDEEGRVKNPRVLESVPGLDEAAMATIKKWRFAPARRNGKPVSATARSGVAFRIFDGDKQRRGKKPASSK